MLFYPDVVHHLPWHVVELLIVAGLASLFADCLMAFARQHCTIDCPKISVSQILHYRAFPN